MALQITLPSESLFATFVAHCKYLRHHKRGNIVAETLCFLSVQTRKDLLRKQIVSEHIQKHFCFWELKQILLVKQMFPGAAKGKTFASAIMSLQTLLPRLQAPCTCRQLKKQKLVTDWMNCIQNFTAKQSLLAAPPCPPTPPPLPPPPLPT